MNLANDLIGYAICWGVALALVLCIVEAISQQIHHTVKGPWQ
jgi:hypothetical protein